MDFPPEPIYFYFQFIAKLIRAGRGEDSKPYFRLNSEISHSDFIEFANRFIEDYHATVSPEFALTHHMKFCFGIISEDGIIQMCPTVRSKEVHKYPAINGGILYIETMKDEKEENRTLDGSIFRQACFIRRERLKFLIAVLGSAVAVITLALSLFFRK
ncbi:MAG: hypothetical protein Q8K67_04645 [Geothrix sp.]|nr:hypothetical protein [Geothrix sp.]